MPEHKKKLSMKEWVKKVEEGQKHKNVRQARQFYDPMRLKKDSDDAKKMFGMPVEKKKRGGVVNTQKAFTLFEHNENPRTIKFPDASQKKIVPRRVEPTVAKMFHGGYVKRSFFSWKKKKPDTNV